MGEGRGTGWRDCSLEMDTRIDDTRGGSRLTTKANHVQRPLVFATHSKQLAIQVFLSLHNALFRYLQVASKGLVGTLSGSRQPPRRYM
jgi:hypothetical protein